MTARADLERRAADLETRALTKLTPEERALQIARGRHYRRLLREATEDLLEGVERTRVGIMLSGGVDSTSILWTLLELGVRPHVYTFRVPNRANPVTGSDAYKAQQLAERYRLPFRIIDMPSDPEELVATIERLSRAHPGLASRPDFEVLPILERMIMEARDRDGVRNIFSGIADGGIHLTTRKLDIRGRGGGMLRNESNARRLFHMENHQEVAITAMAVNCGVNILLPLDMVAAQNPYHEVPWKVMHAPRKKEITLGAWLAEELDSGIAVVSQPLQTGDSGCREYYDTTVPASRRARELAQGRSLNKAQGFYNALNALKEDPTGGVTHSDSETKLSQWFDYFAYVTDGKPLPAEWAALIDPRTGRLHPPEVPEDADDLLGLNAELGVKYKLDGDGEPDTRVDCVGNAFYHGDDVAMTSCPRAQAGYCGGRYPEVPYDITRCELWDNWGESMAVQLESMGAAATQRVRDVLQRWADRSRRTMAEIREGTYEFS